MFFNKQKEINLEVKPLNYWEVNSYMIFPINEKYISRDTIINKLKTISNFNIIGIAEPDDEKDGRIVFKYNNEKFEIGYYFNEFKMPRLYDYQLVDFNEEEISLLNDCSDSLVIYMDYDGTNKLKYKLQLLIGYTIIENIYGVLDESAEKLLHPSLVEMIINSAYLPSDETLYSIQVIADDDKIWMHTHGLSRYSLPEIEIIDSNKDIYREQYNIITTLANHLLDEGLSEDNNYVLGYLEGEIPLIVTLIPWNDALKEYDGIDLGGPKDRELEHNTNNKIIFTYESELDLINKKYSKLSIYDSIITHDPLFLITNSETERMSNVAIERFNYVIDSFSNKNNTILIKIGIKNNNTNETEHIWFELEDILEDNKLKVKLINKPYNDDLIEGESYIYELDNITDWIIYMEDKTINPDNVYLIK